MNYYSYYSKLFYTVEVKDWVEYAYDYAIFERRGQEWF